MELALKLIPSDSVSKSRLVADVVEVPEAVCPLDLSKAVAELVLEAEEEDQTLLYLEVVLSNLTLLPVRPQPQEVTEFELLLQLMPLLQATALLLLLINRVIFMVKLLPTAVKTANLAFSSSEEMVTPMELELRSACPTLTNFPDSQRTMVDHTMSLLDTMMDMVVMSKIINLLISRPTIPQPPEPQLTTLQLPERQPTTRPPQELLLIIHPRLQLLLTTHQPPGLQLTILQQLLVMTIPYLKIH